MEIFPETGQSHGKDFGRVEDYGYTSLCQVRE